MLSETIKTRLAERFAAPLPEFYKRRIVFWYDEDGEFFELADELANEGALSGVSLVKLTGKNNFAVKKLLTEDDPAGDYLVYCPLACAQTQDDWLLDIELYSGEYRADLVSMQMEELRITPSPEMRRTVRLYSKFLDSRERKAKLRRIGREYQTPAQLHIDIMAVLCGLNGGSAQDVLIAVLSAGLDREEDNPALVNIGKFGNIEAFWRMAQKYTGYANDGSKPLASFASHVLLTALSQTMNAAALKGLERFVSESCKAYCYGLVHEWQRGEKREDLLEICRRVERELRLAERFDKMEVEPLLTSDTFPSIDESVLKRFLDEAGEGAVKPDRIRRTVENRRTKAWYGLTADYFDSLYPIAEMQEFYLEHAAGFRAAGPKAVWKAYTDGGYRMDSHYRHFHLAFGNALKNPNPLLEDALKKAADAVEGLYHNWYLKELTAAWTDAAAGDLKTLGCVSEIERQRDFYSRYVLAPASSGKGGRAFVVVSDGLRYEAAAELAEQLSRTTRGKVVLEAQQAVFPSITKFGMAALLPGKEISVDENMAVFRDGWPTASTEQRGAVLRAANAGSAAVRYTDLLKMKQQERRDLTAGKEVVYIYHDTIDAAGDKPQTEMKVFEACGDAIQEIANIVRIVVNELYGTNIFITADHGFLYTYSPLEESEKIASRLFDGNVCETGRRYALTEPETSAAEYLLPVNTGREIGGFPVRGYAPRETVRFQRQGGGENYVHGGISLQEMAVPVIVYKNMRAGRKQYVEVKNPGLALLSESRKVSNLIFSLDFLQKTPVGEKVQPCTYTLRFVNDEGAPVSDTRTVIADRASGNASERVFRVRFNLKSMAFDRNKIYRLVIANETDVPEETGFHIDTFGDDFGFDL
jgi:uncharacterized protein (TIGR02687 family)